MFLLGYCSLLVLFLEKSRKKGYKKKFREIAAVSHSTPVALQSCSFAAQGKPMPFGSTGGAAISGIISALSQLSAERSLRQAAFTVLSTPLIVLCTKHFVGNSRTFTNYAAFVEEVGE